MNFNNSLSLFENYPTLTSPKFNLEQHSTTLPILKEYFNLFPDNDNGFVIDFGCGTGKLSVLASLLGSKKIIGIDVDRESLDIARTYLKEKSISNISLIHSQIEFFPIENFKGKIQGVIMNPPFGTKRKFIDLVFLRKAFETKGWVLSLHKFNPQSWKKIELLANDYNYTIIDRIKLSFHIHKTHNYHILDNYRIKVVLCKFFPK